MNNEEKYVLMMPVVKTEEKEVMFNPSSGMDTAIDALPVETLVNFAKTFTGFELDTIEVHIRGVAKSGGITQLVVGLEGEAGVKLTLKKNKN
ncbi:hypothetical protein ACE3MZ_13005 [Paenibacillus sp. WLX1005]|uniref:hypothetical protein n=1 Tax=Paenibacillus sp. WLX1005 TaxID=3243766 RepID=UPI0039843D3B